jgi:hypothetical protein
MMNILVALRVGNLLAKANMQKFINTQMDKVKNMLSKNCS